MILATAGAFALHDAAGGVHAAGIAFVARGVRFVFDRALYGGIALPALASDEEQVILGDVSKQLAVALMNALKLGFTCEVLDVCHVRFSNQFVIEGISDIGYKVNKRYRFYFEETAFDSFTDIG